jgi:transcriptional regulator with XRE-family HTH domain
MDIGRRIREVREEVGMAGAVLARRAGVSKNHLYMIEHGDRTPSVALLESIARELKVEPADLLREPVPLEEAPQAGQPIPLEPLRSRPGVWEWLLKQGHVPREDFPALARGLSNEDEVDEAIDELHETKARILEGLRDPSVQKTLFGPVRPGDFEGRKARMGEVFRPGKLASEVEWEIRSEYLARETALVNYGRELFVKGEAEDYLVREPVGERDRERHELMLEERRRRVLEGKYAAQLAAV